jgi:hypothetical protein
MRATLGLGGTLLVATLAGCAPSNCDPSQAGFISGIGCEASGAYSQRRQMQQAQLASSRASVLAERANAAAAQDEAAMSQAALRDRQQRLRAVDSQNAALRRRLATLRASNSVDQSRLAAAQGQLDELNRERANIATAPDDVSVRDLETQQKKLLAIIKDMSNL